MAKPLIVVLARFTSGVNGNHDLWAPRASRQNIIPLNVVGLYDIAFRGQWILLILGRETMSTNLLFDQLEFVETVPARLK